MTGQLAYGFLVSMATIAIQVLATIVLIRAMQHLRRRIPSHLRTAALIMVMIFTGALLTAAHLVEVGLWSLAYVLVDAAAKDPFYLAFVNFTTLGYGDILPRPEWHLLGPFTAANGMLLFGWSTAVIYAVLSKAMQELHFY